MYTMTIKNLKITVFIFLFYYVSHAPAALFQYFDYNLLKINTSQKNLPPNPSFLPASASTILSQNK